MAIPPTGARVQGSLVSELTPPGAASTVAIPSPAQSAPVSSAGTVEHRAVAALLRATSAPRPSTKEGLDALKSSLGRATTALNAATNGSHPTAAMHSYGGRTLTQRAAEAAARIDARHAAPKPSSPPSRKAYAPQQPPPPSGTS